MIYLTAHHLIVYILSHKKYMIIWGNLPKSQSDSETIEECIARLIAEHNNKTTAHSDPGQSLDLHRKDTIIDHPAGSIKNDKESFANILYRLFFTDRATWSQVYGVQNFAQCELSLTANGSQDTLGVYQPLSFYNNDLFSNGGAVFSHKMSIQAKFNFEEGENFYFKTGANVFSKTGSSAYSKSNQVTGFKINFCKDQNDLGDYFYYADIYVVVSRVYYLNNNNQGLSEYSRYIGTVIDGVLGFPIDKFNQNSEWLGYEIEAGTEIATDFNFQKYNQFAFSYINSEHKYYFYLNGVKVAEFGTEINSTFTNQNGTHRYELHEGRQQQLGAMLTAHDSALLNNKKVTLFDPIISIDSTY